MKVKELIEKLKSLDQEKEIYTEDDFTLCPIEQIDNCGYINIDGYVVH